jgi:hypothetical protein
MANSNVVVLLGKTIKRTVLPWILPRISDLPLSEWDECLTRARATPFDLVEKIGVLLSVVFVTYLLRFDAIRMDDLSLPLRYIVQFLAAVPLLILFAGPFYLRCLRRALDLEIERRNLVG